LLIIMAGLPATGKTSIAAMLARQIDAVHLRVDTIEQAIVRAGAGNHPVGPVGYVVAYALAEEHLRQGLTVIADSVNPLAVTRAAWRDVARRADVDYLEVEVVCSDRAEHERRATTRGSDIPGLQPPTWRDIQLRAYEAWDGDRLVLDTAEHTVVESADKLRRASGS
jgi:predicted kinase